MPPKTVRKPQRPVRKPQHPVRKPQHPVHKPQHPVRKPRRTTGDAIEGAVAKLRSNAETIKLRKGVKPHEEERIKEAFGLLFVQQPELPNRKAAERREAYLQFLRNVYQICGAQFVVLCAIAFGRSIVRTYAEKTRLHLPEAIKREERDLKCQVLEDIAAAHPQPAPAPVLYGGLEQTAPVAQTPIPHSLSEPQNAEQQQASQAGSRQAQTTPGMRQHTQAESQTGEVARNVRAQTGRRKGHNHPYMKTPLTNLL
jgi:hypothetical protein